eukprot:4466415-Alexandrium_andersonii.AAC.1
MRAGSLSGGPAGNGAHPIAYVQQLGPESALAPADARDARAPPSQLRERRRSTRPSQPAPEAAAAED